MSVCVYEGESLHLPVLASVCVFECASVGWRVGGVGEGGTGGPSALFCSSALI